MPEGPSFKSPVKLQLQALSQVPPGRSKVFGTYQILSRVLTLLPVLCHLSMLLLAEWWTMSLSLLSPSLEKQETETSRRQEEEIQTKTIRRSSTTYLSKTNVVRVVQLKVVGICVVMVEQKSRNTKKDGTGTICRKITRVPRKFGTGGALLSDSPNRNIRSSTILNKPT